MTRPSNPISLKPTHIFLGMSLMILAALYAVQTLSPRFNIGTTTAQHPVIALAVYLLIAILAWVGTWYFLHRYSDRLPVGKLFWLVFGIGLAARLIFWNSVSIYEDDWQRYLWDGAQVAEGLNPYQYSPSEIELAAQTGTNSDPALSDRVRLSNEGGDIVSKINNPDLTTLYPPMAQIAFAAAYWIDPFELDGLRAVFLIADIVGFFILLWALPQFAQSSTWSALYWLNPLLIFTTYSGGHMDVLLMPPILLAILWGTKRPLLSGTALSIAVSVKIWPLLLAPIIYRAYRTDFLKLARQAFFVAGLSLLLLLPLILQIKPDAGIHAYSAQWVNSSFLFPLLREVFDIVGITDPNTVTRLLVVFIVIWLSLWFGLISKNDETQLPCQALVLIAVLIWLSPTGYPWYLTWLLILLPFAPRFWAVLLFVGAVSYYTRFWFGEAGHYAVYTHALVPLWYGLPLILFIWRDFYASSS